MISKSGRSWRPAGVLLVILGTALMGGCGLPSETSGRFPVSLRIEGADGITVASLGQLVTLSATAVDQYGELVRDHPPLIWSVDDTAVLQLETGSTFRSVGNGSARVRVRFDPAGMASTGGVSRLANLSADATVTVKQVAVRIIPTLGDGILWAIGQRRQVLFHVLDAAGSPLTGHGPITWSSSDPEVVAVDTAGVVHAVSDGTAQIRGSVDGLTSSTQVRVSGFIRLSTCVTYAEAESESCATIGVVAHGNRMMP